eukprot:CAMPEP_0181220576 /NCGR_PEP_ID=MMETSP1096-20121128/28915_1 /TAXON_ID=156174 ORGANISM="Chrysochromulina ericina, Strain CCMP281" /NCGR_SAMPLE_ID=MMETSP1096 /ASSEMBLY_ACC=CAM_ASM_000453 /LENGTH=196 /DNA_ID=CAMNT_0023313097 /DNA_START=128 /DNA_END=718 /DNA_ORIENTATION=-
MEPKLTIQGDDPGQPIQVANAEREMQSGLRVRQAECQRSRLEITVINNVHGDGVIVSGLGQGSAAEQGVVVGDTILAVDGSKVGDHAKAIAQMESGTGPTCTLTLAGTTHELVLQKSSGRIGITCTNRSGPGVEVTAIEESSIAAPKGVTAGTIILSVNGELVNDHGRAIAIVDSDCTAVRFVLDSDTMWSCKHIP